MRTRFGLDLSLRLSRGCSRTAAAAGLAGILAALASGCGGGAKVSVAAATPTTTSTSTTTAGARAQTVAEKALFTYAA